MNEVTSTSNTMWVSLQQVEEAGLDSTDFRTEADYNAFLEAVSAAEAQRAAGLSNPMLEIPEPIDSSVFGSADTLLMKALEASMSTITEAQIALHEIGVELRKAAKIDRQAERDAQIEDLMNAAKDIMNGAWAALAGGLAAGAVTFTAGAMQAKGAAQGLKTSGSTSGSLESNIQLGNMQMQSWNARATMVQSLGQSIEGISQFVQGYYESKRAEHEAEATEHSYAAEDANEMVSQYYDMLQEIRSKLNEMLQAMSQQESRVWS